MNQKTLLSLGLVALVLSAVFYFAQPNYERTSDKETIRPFASVNVADISRIRIEQGENSVDMEFKNGLWTLPARAGYAADPNKIHSLLVKMFDLSFSQKITDSPSDFDSLGVSDKGIKDGRTKISLQSGPGKTLAGLYLGEYRKGKDANPFGGAKGQYVRADGSNNVYTILESPVAQATVAGWLDTDLINVLQSNIEEIRQYKVLGGSEALELQLKREKLPQGGSVLDFVGTIEPGKKVKEASLNLIRSALENLRFEDVLKNNDEKVKDTAPEFHTEFLSTNGLVYSMQTFRKDTKVYEQLSVRFDEGLKSSVEARVNAERKALEEVKTQAASTPAKNEKGNKPENENDAPVRSPAEQAASEVPMPSFSNAEEAKRLNDKYAGWVYIVPSYNGTKFTQTKETFFQDASATSAPSESDSPVPIPGMGMGAE